MADHRADLIELLKRDALQFGDFVLASGKKSSFYIDCRKVTLSAQGAAVVGQAILELLANETFDAVGGMTLGADPILAAVLTVAGLQNRTLRGFIVRKEAKGHGTGKLIEGPIEQGDRVVIVEDVSTTGGSALKAVEAAQAAGTQVVRVVTLLDRLSGAREAFESRGIPFSALATSADLGLPTS